MQIGANVVHASYVSGSGSPTLIFRYTVTATDVDLDGAQLVVNSIDLNGGTLLNPENGIAVLQFPALTFTGVLVNGAGPLVQNITRLDATPTNATSVRYSVQFTEAVTGVDVSDFSVAMSAGDLAGAVVSSVSGAGTTYEVIVATGTGSGTLGLSVIGTATINDANGDPLGKPYFGGQVYTLRRSEPNDINIFYTDRHADFGPVWNNGEMTFELVADPGVVTPRQVPSDEVYVYLDSNALTSRSTDARFDFLGVPASAPLYRISTSQLTNVPFLGFGGESVPAGVFAGYRPDDPRITSASLLPYLKVQMVNMRSSTDGEFSIWTIASGAPRVWMASSDGISSTDAIYVRSGSHSHFNVGFSKAGVYEVDVSVSGYLDGNGNGVYDPITDPYYESGIFTMVYGIDFLGARDDMFNVGSQETLRGSVTLNDDWDNGLGAYTASVQTTTTNGTLTLQPNGAFTYQPSASFAGSDSFTYRLTNPRGGFTTPPHSPPPTANTVYANYLSGSGTGTLKFRYAVTTSDVDFDGVQLASNVIDLNGGTIKDPLNGNAVLTFPNLTFDGVIVNGAGPLVQGISRLDSRATEAATVRFQIQFAEPVTGVDIDDLAVVMNAGDLTGATIVSVTGSGSLFEVTVSTGTGSGTLGLSVKGTASIFDLNGDILGKGFTGGQVYTVRREAIGDIDTFYTHAHSDYRPTLNNGEFAWILRPDAGLLPDSSYPSEEVYTYLDSTAIVSRPTGANYDFLGVPSGAPLYLSNSAGNVASVPFLGFSGESIFAFAPFPGPPPPLWCAAGASVEISPSTP